MTVHIDYLVQASSAELVIRRIFESSADAYRCASRLTGEGWPTTVHQRFFREGAFATERRLYPKPPRR